MKWKKKVIEFDDSYNFIFLEDSSIKFEHPVSDYYLKINDLSINLFISLKWVLWGFFFFTSISKELEKLENYNFSYIIPDSIQVIDLNFKENRHVFLLDNNLIENENDFYNLLNSLYSNDIFDENTKIHFKLKINLREFLILSHYLFPSLYK